MFMGKIVKAIKTCKITVFISSKDSNQSIHTIKEVAIAFNSGKHIIPFKIDETSYNDHLEYVLCNLNWGVEATNPPTEQALNQLVSQIKAILTVATPTIDASAGQPKRQIISIDAWETPQTKIGVFIKKMFEDKRSN